MSSHSHSDNDCENDDESSMDPANLTSAHPTVPECSDTFTEASDFLKERTANDQPQGDMSTIDPANISSASQVLPEYSNRFTDMSDSPQERTADDQSQCDESSIDPTNLLSVNHVLPGYSDRLRDMSDSPQEWTVDHQPHSNDDQSTCTADVRQGLNVIVKDLNVQRVCGICETTFAEGRCLDCDEDLCSVCIKYHEKLKITSKHNILYFDPPANLKQEHDACIELKGRNNCQKHEEILRFFCKTCRLPVCRDCVLTVHKDHVTGDILDEAQSAREQIQTLLVKAENTKQKFESHRDELKEYENAFLDSSQKVSDIITRLHKDISDRVEQSHRNLLDTVQSTKKNERSRIQHCEQFCNQKLVSVEDFLCKGKQLLSSETGTDMVLQMDVLRQSAPALFNVLSIIPGKGEFVLSRNRNFSKNTAENVIGHVTFTVTESLIQEGEKQAYIREIRLKRDIAFHIWEMKCTKPSIRGICQGLNGVIWIATPKSLIKLGADGTRQSSIHLTSDVSCISEGHEGKLLVAFNRGNGIKVFSHDAMNMWSNYATIPETVVAISIAVDKQRVFVTSAMIQNLIVFCNQGKDMVRVKLPEEMLHDDAVITGMAVGTGGEVAISNSNGKLVILSDSFETKHVYKGPDGIMFPTSICYDKQDHLIIADGKRNTVHLVSKSGCFLAFLLNKDDFQDIGSPTAVCVDPQERLWVGTDMGNICAYKYIHEVL